MDSQKIMIFGPCSLESEAQIQKVADLLRQYQQSYIRCALFKPRTHPDSFQGLGAEGLALARKLKDQGLKLVTEVCSKEQLELVAGLVDIIQIGTRNMQNFELLKAIGDCYSTWKLDARVMLKRGFSATYDEWMASALYLERYGVPHEAIVLCERGSRSFCNPNGVTLDLQMALQAKMTSSYKVIADPSHGSKHSDYVLPLADAIMALPLDGLMIEAHPFPQQSISDAAQAIGLDELESFLKKYGKNEVPFLLSDTGDMAGPQRNP